MSRYGNEWDVPKVGMGVGVIAATVGICFLVINFTTGWRMGNALLNLLIGNWVWMLILTIAIAAIMALFVMEMYGSVIAVTAITFLLLIFVLPSFTYYSADVVRLESVSITEEPSPTYDERAAFPVVKAQIGSAVTINGTLEPSSYIGGKEFTTLVKRVGWAVGYGQVVVQTVDITGQAKARQCAFGDNAQLAFGNLVFNDLGMEIIGRRPGVIIDEADSYGYCDGDKPVVVIPLKYLSGTWPGVIEVSGGVAVYDGITGELTIKDTVKSGEIVGPVYPMSLSSEAYHSTKASQGYWPWLWGAAGLTDTSDDEGDPNAGNVGNFHLIRTDGSGGDYVTPLTRVGISTAISGVGAVSGSETTAGKLNPYVIHTYPDGKVRRANSALADFIKGSFGTEVPWQNGSMIFEISPVSQDVWVASIGLNQSIQFRVRSLLDGGVCLETTGGAKVKCILADGTVEGGAQPEPVEPGGPVETTGLEKMTDKEILDLWDALRAEIEKRMG